MSSHLFLLCWQCLGRSTIMIKQLPTYTWYLYKGASRSLETYCKCCECQRLYLLLSNLAYGEGFKSSSWGENYSNQLKRISSYINRNFRQLYIHICELVTHYIC
uniref:Uncharacterized protein n=1 Tax=Davidia involucrata TaxID=16924 RepID=A0A5B7C0V8_DAVIN